ncbi:MAG: 5-formyltetrahydrofolate cyclo-ligase [Alistipes sp.]|nr:5-formyltetrahydrofolate cyclo-ligase [Alistipes sp.]
MTKKSIRQSIKRATQGLSAEETCRQSDSVNVALREIIMRRKPSVVALFSPLPDEVDITPVIEYLVEQNQCLVVLPRVDIKADKPTMEFYPYRKAEMEVGAYGINEPQGDTPCPAEAIDLMVVPAVAFTRRGERLGRGKGFYDCYLSREGFRAYTVGVCYSHQLLDSLPTEPHDCRVDEVVVGE